MGKNKHNSVDLLNPSYSGWYDIYSILRELYMSTFRWEGLPDTVDGRFLEELLLNNGYAYYFNDSIIGNLVLGGSPIGLDHYNEPKKLKIVATGYQNTVVNHITGAVIYNNNTKSAPSTRLQEYAKRIYNLERTIDVNVQAQKTPWVVVVEDETTQLSMKRLFQQIDRFDPFVIVDKNISIDENVKVLKTEAPFVADKLEEIKRKLWNEALSFIGIENNSSEKNERLTADEVLISNGLAIANKNSRLLARKRAVKEINKIFNVNIDCVVNNIMVTESPIKGIEEEDNLDG